MRATVIAMWAMAACCSALAEPAPLLVLEFEFIDELKDPRTAEADQARIHRSGQALHDALASCPRYRLADRAPAESAIEQASNQNAFLYRCNGCTQDIAAAAGAQLVAFPWVQKVSNLILNLNIEIRNADEEVVIVRSVDLRGNTDRSWERGIQALVERLCPRD